MTMITLQVIGPQTEDRGDSQHRQSPPLSGPLILQPKCDSIPSKILLPKAEDDTKARFPIDLGDP